MVWWVFKKFVNVMRGDDGRGQVQGFLKPIDTEQLAQALDLDRVAKQRGARELPHRDSSSLDGNEQQIIQKLESEWSWHGASLINNLKAYASRLLGVTVQIEFARLELIAQNALSRLRSANHRAESELGPLREGYISARDELGDFRARHGLKRAARISSSRPVTAGLLVILISVEAGANAVFFAKGAELGLLGGLWTAVCISAVNVVVAFAIGFFPLRWMKHRNFMVKLFGLLLAVGGSAVIVAVHGFAAHLREVPGGVDDEAVLATAVTSLRHSPFELHDINSYYLFAIGVVWALVAMWKGYTFDDPYPGYGAHQRRCDHAREAYSDEHDNLFEDLEKIKEDTVAAIDNGITRIPLFPQQAAAIRTEREALRQKFRGYEASVETAANQLLARYRDANRISRKTDPPKYFDQTWRLPHSFLEEPSVQSALGEPSTPSMDANEALAKLQTLSNAVLAEYGDLISKYPHPTQMN
jgi:hypothetical protein